MVQWMPRAMQLSACAPEQCRTGYVIFGRFARSAALSVTTAATKARLPAPEPATAKRHIGSPVQGMTTSAHQTGGGREPRETAPDCHRPVHKRSSETLYLSHKPRGPSCRTRNPSSPDPPVAPAQRYNPASTSHLCPIRHNQVAIVSASSIFRSNSDHSFIVS